MLLKNIIIVVVDPVKVVKIQLITTAQYSRLKAV